MEEKALNLEERGIKVWKRSEKSNIKPSTHQWQSISFSSQSKSIALQEGGSEHHVLNSPSEQSEISFDRSEPDEAILSLF